MDNLSINLSLSLPLSASIIIFTIALIETISLKHTQRDAINRANSSFGTKSMVRIRGRDDHVQRGRGQMVPRWWTDQEDETIVYFRQNN